MWPVPAVEQQAGVWTEAGEQRAEVLGLKAGTAGPAVGQASVTGSETLLICLPPAPVSLGSSSAQRFLTCDI